MQTFDAKKPEEQRIYTCGFQNQIAADKTIVSAAVTAAVYDKSNPRFPDANPSAILQGNATINGAAIEILGQTIPASMAVSQLVKDGVAGCTYVLTFKATLSDGELIAEDVLLVVSKYAPLL
jgi:hypothetical protein